MGLQVILNIHQVDPGTIIDIAGANAHLMTTPAWGGFGELYGEVQHDPNWMGIFTMENGELRIASRDEDELGGYCTNTEVWGCFHKEVAQEFSKFVQSGKVVFHLDIEGNPDKYFICTPNTVSVQSANSLSF